MKLSLIRILCAFGVFLLISRPVLAVDEEITPRFSFVSGEVVSFNVEERLLDVRVYLDSEGNPMEHVLSLSIPHDIQITDGTGELDIDALSQAREVDVEYGEETKKTSYIFVY